MDAQAARRAFLIAKGELPPWAMMQMPSTPSSGMPPYSSALVTRCTARKAGLAEQRAGFADGVGDELALEQAEDAFGQRFAGLEDDIAGEAVGHDDIDCAFKEIVALDIAVEIQAAVLEQAVRGERERVALEFLGADWRAGRRSDFAAEHVLAVGERP